MKCQKVPSFTSSLIYILHLYQPKTVQDRLNWRNLDPELQLYQHRTGKLGEKLLPQLTLTVIPGSLHG